MGNDLRGDDYVGVYIVRQCSHLKNKNVTFFNAGITPEKILEKVNIDSYEIILISDSCDFGGSPGEIRIFEANNDSIKSLSAHTVPVNVISRIIKEDYCITIYILCIQAGICNINGEMSTEVQKSADAIISDLTFLDVNNS